MLQHLALAPLASLEWLTVLSFLVGAVHVLAPDHWVPTSVLAWRRAWSKSRTTALAFLLLSAHTLAGLALYGALVAFAARAGRFGTHLFTVTLVMVGLAGLIRIARYSRVREALQSSPASSFWSFVTIAAIVGPAESLVPVLVRAGSGDPGIEGPLIAFWLGTLASGLACVLGGPWVWDRPLLLPRGMALALQRRTAIPIVMGVVVALALLLRAPG